MRTYRDFFESVLKRLDITPHPRVLNALAAVATLEGLNDRYNPLNSVVPSGKSTAFNSVGVQDYKSYGNGVNGTVKLLRGEPWVNVVEAMRKGARTAEILRQFQTVYATWDAHVTFPHNHALLDQCIDGDHETVSEPAKHPTTKRKDKPTLKRKDRRYTVKDHDTLFTIAGKVFDGQNGRWREIAHANKIIAPYTIYPGQKLTIPTE